MKNILFYIIIGIILAFIFFRECTRPGYLPPASDTIRITDTIPGDSIPYPVKIAQKVPVPVYIDTGSTRWRDRPVDTMAILKDYFAKYFYDDVLMDDTSAYIRLMAHTFRNKLFYDSLFFQNRRKTAISTTIINPYPKEKLKVYAGIGTSFGTNRLALTGNLLFIMLNKGYAISGGYDFINKEIEVKGYIPIRFKKKK